MRQSTTTSARKMNRRVDREKAFISDQFQSVTLKSMQQSLNRCSNEKEGKREFEKKKRKNERIVRRSISNILI